MSNSKSRTALPAINPEFTDDKRVLALSDVEWRTVSEILRNHLPGRTVWAYGSRARKERVKRFSDLDLAVEGSPLSSLERVQLAEAFDESPLPFRVDVVETCSLSSEFRLRIEVDKIILTRG